MSLAILNRWWLPGSIALLVVLLMTGLPLAALIATATDLSLSSVIDNSYYRRVIWFSFYQAIFSALLSVGLGVPLALALSREQTFPGRKLLINLFSLSLVIPTLLSLIHI